MFSVEAVPLDDDEGLRMEESMIALQVCVVSLYLSLYECVCLLAKRLTLLPDPRGLDGRRRLCNSNERIRWIP